MKKIVTRKDRERKERINQFIIGVILIGMMTLGTVGYALSDKGDDGVEKMNYQGIDFLREGDYWVFNFNGYEFITVYNPEDVKDISFNSYQTLQNYAGKPLYFEGELGEHSLEIQRNLGERFVLRFGNACLSNSCNGDYPLKNCSLDNIISSKIPKENESESIYQEDNCIFITASYQNQTKYSNKFLFSILGIN